MHPARLLFLVLFAASLWTSCRNDTPLEQPHRPSHAGEALRSWAMARIYPDGKFYVEKYAQALQQLRESARLRGPRNNTWEALGPKNIGGRTLCLAVHPQDTNILWVGSASGGIWKSNSAGRGVAAWEYVETGFPVLGVSAIAIDPENPQILYAGTGEVYNYEESSPNVAFRTTRGTYGIGILKSEDGGASWFKSLDWSYGQLRGVQDIRINPLRPATIWAATTEGLIRSYDAGASWHMVHNVEMAVDIELHPLDTNLIMVSHGSLDDNAYSGIYRSINGGSSWTKLQGGLPAAFSGKALLALHPGQPNTWYASVGNAFVQEGLYRSTTNGTSWTKVNSTDVCKYQGWYSHDVSVQPDDPNTLVWVGIDAWKSTNGGTSVQKKTSWSAWYFGQVPVGGPEGPPNYVHADIHRIYHMPQDPLKVYAVTDGGIFVSYDGGESWEGRNGGYQTQQFYANLGNSTTNPDLCIGGMQDNSTAIYTGDPAWTRVLGGDGECAAIHPFNDQVMFGSSQYLNMYRSLNGGANWSNITPPDSGPENAAFNGPFEIAPADPDILFAGAESIFRSLDAGNTWGNASNGPVHPGAVVLTITPDPGNANILWCSTTPANTQQARVYRLDLESGSKTAMTGLPNRICMDIAVHPVNPNMVYCVFGGFNTNHVYRTLDGGANWSPVDNGLPDIPTNTILIDPVYPEHVYIGNDVGIWLSTNGGNDWEPWSSDAPAGFLAMHLSISADRKLRAATYGLGVWQTDMAEPVSVPSGPAALLALHTWPNPASTVVNLDFTLSGDATVGWRLHDAGGRLMRQRTPAYRSAGTSREHIATDGLPAGIYLLQMEGKSGASGKTFTATRKIVVRP